jgi:hypothetical protein
MLDESRLHGIRLLWLALPIRFAAPMTLLDTLRRIPFTLTLLTAMGIVAIMTDAHLAPLEARWLDRFGFASTDLFAVDLGRIATSAITTHGQAIFWRALVAVSILVGLAEWRSGTRQTLFVFSATHALTLVALAVFVRFGLRVWHPPLADVLEATRDVGPSAGYFGCLGMICSSLPPRVAWSFGGLTFGLLGLQLAILVTTAPLPAVDVSAVLAHVIALPLGCILSQWRIDGLRARTGDSRRDGSDSRNDLD